MNEQQQEVASNWLTGSGWVIVVFIGAFILIAAIAWARAQNAKRSPRDEARTLRPSVTGTNETKV